MRNAVSLFLIIAAIGCGSSNVDNSADTPNAFAEVQDALAAATPDSYTANKVAHTYAPGATGVVVATYVRTGGETDETDTDLKLSADGSENGLSGTENRNNIAVQSSFDNCAPYDRVYLPRNQFEDTALGNPLAPSRTIPAKMEYKKFVWKIQHKSTNFLVIKCDVLASAVNAENAFSFYIRKDGVTTKNAAGAVTVTIPKFEPEHAESVPVITISGTSVNPDAGTMNVDAGDPPADAGAMPVDAGTMSVDAGPVDAGSPVDAGPVDAGQMTPDAGSPVDAGMQTCTPSFTSDPVQGVDMDCNGTNESLCIAATQFMISGLSQNMFQHIPAYILGSNNFSYPDTQADPSVTLAGFPEITPANGYFCQSFTGKLVGESDVNFVSSILGDDVTAASAVPFTQVAGSSGDHGEWLSMAFCSAGNPWCKGTLNSNGIVEFNLAPVWDAQNLTPGGNTCTNVSTCQTDGGM